jgi:photosystem II stability/assembly factor-like uncharacterized protein
MMSDSTSDVLVSADGGQTWRRYPNCPGVPAKAIEYVRDTNADLKANDDALYFATGAFKARMFEKEMIASYNLVEVDLDKIAEVEAESGANG